MRTPEYRRRQEDAAEQQRQSEKHKETVQAVATVVTAIDGLVADRQADRDHRQRSEKKKSVRERRTLYGIWVTAAGALLTTVVASVTVYVTHCDTSHLIKDARDIADRQHGDTVEALDQARRQANTAEEALHSVQRAFITVTDLREEVFADQAGKRLWRYTPGIENSGVTPTTKMTVVAIKPHDDWVIKGTLIFREAMGNRDPNQNTTTIQNRFLEIYRGAGPIDPAELLTWSPPDLPDSSIIPNAVLGPKATMYPSGASDEISIEDTDRSQADSIGRYFYGAISYTDIFRHNHITKYCFSIAGSIRASPTGDRPLKYLCRHWNCVDQACDEDKASYDEDAKGVVQRNEEVRQRQQRTQEKLKRPQEQLPTPPEKR